MMEKGIKIRNNMGDDMEISGKYDRRQRTKSSYGERERGERQAGDWERRSINKSQKSSSVLGRRTMGRGKTG